MGRFLPRKPQSTSSSSAFGAEPKSSSRVPGLLALGVLASVAVGVARKAATSGEKVDSSYALGTDRVARAARALGGHRTAGELMTRGVLTLAPTSTLTEAARSMRDAQIGALPVVQDGHIIGIVTDRDLAVRALADGKDPHATTVSDVMTHDVLSVRESDRVTDVIRRMGERQVRRLPVLNAQDQLVGMLALGDVAVRAKTDTDRVLEQVSKPSPEKTA